MRHNPICTTIESVDIVLAQQKTYFESGATSSVHARKATLITLREAVHKHTEAILEALYQDLKKPKTESYLGEIVPVLRELNHAIDSVHTWTKQERLHSDTFFPLSTPWISSEPYGVSLIITPFNYPFSISLGLLVGAIAAGNCVIIKPSEKVPNSLQVLEMIINEVFEKNYVALAVGEATFSQELLTRQFDHIYFIGSTSVGKHVMASAAQNLTPLCLGLSGKCPAIVDATVDLKVIAKRIIWAKCMNNGQSCTAIDYLLVEESIREQLLSALATTIQEFYGTQVQESKDYGRLVDEKHFDRVSSFLSQGTVYYGGLAIRDDKFIEPTILTDIKEDASIRKEEIFGPILPVFTFSQESEALSFIQKNPNPLAIYLFSNDKKLCNLIEKSIHSGGVCINDALIHNISPMTPGGGVHQSGFGRLHGKYSFDSFSYKRTYLKRKDLLDLPGRFPPYKESLVSLLRKLF